MAIALASVLGWIVIGYAYVPLDAPHPIGTWNSARRIERIIHDFDVAHASAGTSADKPVPSSMSGDERSRLREEIRSAIRLAPLDPRLLRRLGQLEEAEGRAGKAELLMREAVRQSRQESIAILWLLHAAHAKGDYAGIADHADALLRTRRSSWDFGFKLLGRMAEDPTTPLHVAAILAAHPPWRWEFLRTIANHAIDPRSVYQLAALLKTSVAPLSKTEMAPVLAFLAKHEAFALAYYAWLDSLPPEQLERVGLLNNGSFEQPAGNSPFDWAISSGAGVIIDIVAESRGNGARVLSVAFSRGRVDFGGVEQMTVLGPGRYRLTGRYQGDFKGQRGLQWRISCAGRKGERLGQSATFSAVAREWTDFGVSFVVPRLACAAQTVHLVLDAQTNGERFASGEVLFGDLRIQVVGNLR